MQTENIWEPETKVSQFPATTLSIRKTPAIRINLKRIFSVWPFVLVFGIMGFIAANIYLRYIDTIYYVSTSVIIDQDNEINVGQALMGSARDPLNNKIAFLRSPSFALQIVDSLKLQYHAVVEGRFKNKDYYNYIKWFILNVDSVQVPPSLRFTIFPLKNGFRYESGKIKGESDWGKPFRINNYDAVVEKLGDFAPEKGIQCFTTETVATAFKLSSSISVQANKESNIIQITYSDISSERGINILNAVVNMYNKVMENDKSQAFSQAIDFITRRLGPLGKDLDSIETSLAHYKSQKGFIGTTANGALYQAKVTALDKQLADMEILKANIATVSQFIESPNLKDENFALVGITDPTLQSNLSQYYQLLRDKDRIGYVGTVRNPAYQSIERRIAEVKGNIDVQMDNYKKNLHNVETSYLENKIDADRLLHNTPYEEKELIDKSRMLNIKESLFLTLLQKKEEASIAKASVTVQTKVLSPPVKLASLQTPSRGKILGTGVLIGFLIPIGFAFTKEILNKKIISKKQLQAMTDIPVLAELEHAVSVNETPFVIDKVHRSMFGEQIRSLRTNLSFYMSQQKKCTTILITSSVSGEGKSFLSLNLSRSYSLQGKKVAIVEFDLRRPKVSKALGIKPKAGLSNVLIGKCEMEDIKIEVLNDDQERLDFYPAGAIPPNPQELISGAYMKKAKDYLNANYDLVVIDTPPYGIVADAQLLGEYADVSLVLVRFQQTINEQVQEINDWNNTGVFKQMALVFNGVKQKGYYGSRYGNYYYKKKYGYNYYNTGEKS